MFYLFTLIFLIGLMFGSFASVIIHRLHTKEQGILFGRSKCPYCAHKLGVIDLVPIASYLISKFKCRYCHEPIAMTYPLLELVMGVLFFLTASLVGINDVVELIFYLFIIFIFVLISFYDLLFKEIPDEIILPATVLVFAYQSLTGAHPPIELLLGMAVPVAFFGALFLGSRGKWIGGGDIRIGALMGAVLGWPFVLIGLFLSYFIGAVFSGIGLITKHLNRKSQIPFAPFLLGGTYITIFWGQEILNWYLGIM